MGAFDAADDRESSPFLQHEHCPSCGSADALARYEDGSGWCFSCATYDRGTKIPDAKAAPRKKATMGSPDLILNGEVKAIPNRGLTEETCRKYGYLIGHLSDGSPVHIAPYYAPDGTLIGQKIRPRSKDDMFVVGTLKKAMLFGQQLFPAGGKRVIVIEGEIDALVVSQAQGNKWPAVSVKRGAASAAKDLAENIEWLESFEEIILCFDMDPEGRRAVEECSQLFTPGKVKIVHLPGFKDPCEMHVAGKTAELVRALWDARPYRPDGIRSFADVASEAKAPIQEGLPWFNKRITELTYGRRYGEVACIGAGTGVGKTDFIMQQVAFDVMKLEEKVGLFFFEQQNFETAKRLAGKQAGKAFHIPDAGWAQWELDSAVDDIAATDRVFLYNHFGQTDWEVIKSRIKFLAVSQGVKIIYIDNLTALADPANERESLETMMGEVAGLAQAHGLWIFLVSHLSTPAGSRPHEEGGKVLLQHFKGARAIGFWLSFAFGIERNRLAEDPVERRMAKFVFIKDRYTGRSDGEFIYFQYNPQSCLLDEFKGELPESMREGGHSRNHTATSFEPYVEPTPSLTQTEESASDADIPF